MWRPSRRPAELLVLSSLLMPSCSEPKPAKPAEVVQEAPQPALDAAQLRAQAEALVARWVQTQNAADLAGYLSLYDPKHFLGIKRSHRRDTARELRFEGWKRERTELFKLAPVVQVERVSVQSWLDAGSRLKSGVVEVSFLQRWRGGQYGDHGRKELKLWRDGQGSLKIVREDMLDSQVGFDDAPVLDANTSWKVPATRDDALALWRTLAPTGANHQQVLKSIPADPAIRVPLARALIADGNLSCNEIDEDDECGVTVHRFRPLAPEATFEDPCLRRQLLDWALDALVATKSTLTPRELRMLLALPMPTHARDSQRLPLEESELPHKVLTLSESAEPKVRLALLLQAGARFAEVARPHMNGLSNSDLKAVYEQLNFPEALLHMDPALDHDSLLSAVANAEFPITEMGDSPENLRRDLFSRLFARESPLTDLDRSLLPKLSEHDDCLLGQRADEVLRAHGEPVQAGLTDTLEHTLHTLCKLGQAVDRGVLVPLVHDPKHYSEHEYHEDISEQFLDDNGVRLPNDPSNIRRARRVGKKALPPTIPFSHHHDIECTEQTCTVTSYEDDTSCDYTVNLTQTDAGYRLESLRTKCTSQSYCPC